MGGPPRSEVGDTMIHTATPDLVASCSPHVQRTWGTHGTTPPLDFREVIEVGLVLVDLVWHADLTV